MIDAGDLEQMQADLQAVRSDRETSIALRRGDITLAAQTVRIARTGSGGRSESGAARETRGDVVVLGSTTFDVRIDDRFNDGGQLYRIKFVRPNRRAATIADAEIVE